MKSPAVVSILAVAALSLLGPPGGSSVANGPAGLYFEQSTLVRSAGVVEGPGVVSRVWYAGRRMRMEAGDAPGGPALVLQLDLGKAWRLDPEQKVATEIDTARLREKSRMDASLAGDLMGGAQEGRVRVAPLRAPKTIAGHACRGYRLTGPSVVLDLYLAEDLPVGVDAFAEFIEWSGAGQSMAGILVEVRKLKGFPLQTRSRVTVLDRVHETLSTITTVRVGPQPPGLFEVPAGWRVVADTPDSEKE